MRSICDERHSAKKFMSNDNHLWSYAISQTARLKRRLATVHDAGVNDIDAELIQYRVRFGGGPSSKT